MSTYKVIQDIEAEDKLIGPLTLRQFIYAGAAVLSFYLTFLVVTKGIGFMAVVFLPIGIISGFFAWPWSRDQPTEIWALAKIRFMVKPRKRIWNQSGVKELVTITVPKKVETVYTNGLSQDEVRSRLKALADTIDTRGWVIKNVDVSAYTRSNFAMAQPSDRLVNLSTMPQPVPALDIQPADDMLDEQNNPTARQLDDKLNASSKAHRQKLINTLKKDAPVEKKPKNDYWFLSQPAAPSAVAQDAVTFNTQIVTPTQQRTDQPGPGRNTPAASNNDDDDEAALLQELSAKQKIAPQPLGHLHTIQPLSAQQSKPPVPAPIADIADTPATPPEPATTKMTQTPPPDILDLAGNNDFNIATIAREAHKRRELPPDEVVISLH